jgi:transposase-like protein
LLDSLLSERRDRDAARRFLRRLLETTHAKPLRLTTDKHPAYGKAIRWIVGRKALHRTERYLNNRTEQSHRHIKQRYYPMLGFGNFESASRFCRAFDELRNYFRIRMTGGEAMSALDRRRTFKRRWSTLMAALSA